jgi:hypothetical protein
MQRDAAMRGRTAEPRRLTGAVNGEAIIRRRPGVRESWREKSSNCDWRN